VIASIAGIAELARDAGKGSATPPKPPIGPRPGAQ
jgi:hypothetical protein